MKLVSNPTEPPPAEVCVRRMDAISTDALNNLHQALIQTWKLLWEDPESRLAKLAVLGNAEQQAAAFAQHARTWAFLEASGVAVDDKYKAPPPDFVMPG